MKIIYNNLIPFKGFIAMNFCGLLFVRKEYKGKITDRTINLESIHSAQIKEMIYIFFYIWYILEWLFRIFQYGESHEAYRNLSFEREAYLNDKNGEYLKTRKLFSSFRYLRIKNK